MTAVCVSSGQGPRHHVRDPAEDNDQPGSADAPGQPITCRKCLNRILSFPIPYCSVVYVFIDFFSFFSSYFSKQLIRMLRFYCAALKTRFLRRQKKKEGSTRLTERFSD